jgi:hypothetical protein
VIDDDGDGFAPVIVDGSQSSDPANLALTYRWLLGEQTLAAAVSRTLLLPEGDHYLRLRVTNSDGLVDTDAVRVRVVPPTHHGENLLPIASDERDETTSCLLLSTRQSPLIGTSEDNGLDPAALADVTSPSEVAPGHFRQVNRPLSR